MEIHCSKFVRTLLITSMCSVHLLPVSVVTWYVTGGKVFTFWMHPVVFPPRYTRFTRGEKTGRCSPSVSLPCCFPSPFRDFTIVHSLWALSTWLCVRVWLRMWMRVFVPGKSKSNEHLRCRCCCRGFCIQGQCISGLMIGSLLLMPQIRGPISWLVKAMNMWP